MFATYIEAVIYVSSLLEGSPFGLEEIPPKEGHGLAYAVSIEAGDAWIVYKPLKVTYWVVVPDTEYV